MQRWIVLGAVAMVLFLGGSYAGYKVYQQNRPGPIWVPLPIRADLGKAEREDACNKLKTVLTQETNILAVVKDLNLMQEWGLDSEAAAADELKRRIFVRQGRAQTELGEVPSIDVGIQGKQKEKPMTGKILMRVMEDVKKAVGSQHGPGGR